MSVQLDARLENTRTRSQIFSRPRFLLAFSQLEIVTISVPPNEMQRDPADTRSH